MSSPVSKNRVIKLLSLSILIICIGSAAVKTVHGYQEKEPISEEGLMRLLQNGIQPANIIRAIEDRGVSFQLTSSFEGEISRAGRYFGQRGLNDLLSAIRNNFRPPAKRPFRITYRLLEGHAVDLFLDGNIDKAWDKELAGRNFIVQNGVFRTLSYLVKTFSEPFGGDEFLKSGAGNVETRSNTELAELYKKGRKRLFVGSISASLSEDPLTLINSLSSPNEQWRVYITADRRSRPSHPIDNFTFLRFANRQDLDYVEKTALSRFYSYITKDYLPPDFASIWLSLSEPGCGAGDDDLETDAGFSGPVLKLNVAIIENVSNEPFGVGRFLIKENNSERLRSREEDQSARNLQPSQKQDLFPPSTLRPGERLVVPVELSLETDNSGAVDEEESGSPGYADVLARVRAKGGISFPTDKKSGLPTMSAEVLERIMNRGVVPSPKEYIYGPSASIESLEINRYAYLVRQFDPSKLMITSSAFREGSCPYVYTYSAGENSWLSEGVILYGNNGKLRESSDEMLLRRFDGRVLLKENDPEDSFVDLVQIRAMSRDGSETLLYPKNLKLRFADGDYVELRRGQQLMIDFDVPEGFVAKRYVVVASGYYIPYKVRPTDSDPRRMIPRRIRKLRLADIPE